jgi:hypothetical protein
VKWLEKSIRVAAACTGCPTKSEPQYAPEWTPRAAAILCLKKCWKRSANCTVIFRHCEERSDEAIHSFFSAAGWIASLRSQ